MKKRLMLILFAVLALTTAVSTGEIHGPDETAYAYKVKAVFMHHFLRYLKWPDDNTAKPYNIAFIGDSPVITPLKQIASQKTVNERKIAIKEFQNFSDIDLDMDKYHLLFICRSTADNSESLEDILDRAFPRHIVTVSDQNGFAKKGVAINFVMIEGRITFEMNVKAIRRAGIYPSSQILKLAILVEEENEGEIK